MYRRDDCKNRSLRDICNTIDMMRTKKWNGLEKKGKKGKKKEKSIRILVYE
jgi:hypothetical protein